MYPIITSHNLLIFNRHNYHQLPITSYEMNHSKMYFTSRPTDSKNTKLDMLCTSTKETVTQIHSLPESPRLNRNHSHLNFRMILDLRTQNNPLFLDGNKSKGTSSAKNRMSLPIKISTHLAQSIKFCPSHGLLACDIPGYQLQGEST